MTYNSGTDSYQADFLENILDTAYKYGVPYIIDREKYESAMKEFKKEVRIKDANVVVFHADYNKEEDRDIYSYTFFAWPKNSPEGSKDFYDCSQFWDYDYDYKHKEKFEEFVHAILESVVGVDVPTAMNLRGEKAKELRLAFKELDELDDIIFSAK
jgi:endonuclease IV